MEIALTETDRRLLQSHTLALQIHSRALSAHAECLGMNAENMMAACANKVPPYADEVYIAVMRKWEVVGIDNKPII